MKILFTESQILGLLKEQYNERKYGDYVNRLLDKISSSGLLSLSDEERDDLTRLSQGEDIIPDEETPEPKFQSDYDDEDEYSNDDDGDLMDAEPKTDDQSIGAEYQMFMDLVSFEDTLTVDGVVWNISRKEIQSGFDIMFLSDGDRNIGIVPFKDGNKFFVKGPTEQVSFQVHAIPKNEEEMGRFFDSFMEKDLSIIIKKMTKIG